MYFFSPLTMKSSPSGTAVVSIDDMSEPKSGSVIEMATPALPAMTSGRYLSRTASLLDIMRIVAPAPEVRNIGSAGTHEVDARKARG
jgi:hypothetical protein